MPYLSDRRNAVVANRFSVSSRRAAAIVRKIEDAPMASADKRRIRVALATTPDLEAVLEAEAVPAEAEAVPA